MSVQNKIHFVTDAWHPQVNGVVVLLSALKRSLENLGIDVQVAHPGMFPRLPMPGYPEIKLTTTPWRLKRHIDTNDVQWVHIATEGPLGLSARSMCIKKHIPFSTAIHTKFPEYAQVLVGVPRNWGYNYLRWFHSAARFTVVQTETQLRELESKGLQDLRVVGGGVDTDLFRPQPLAERSKPRLLYVGRVSKEKSIDDFLNLEFEADKVVVGDGPDRSRLERTFPHVQFRGYRKGNALVEEYAQADCLVFPSRTDTFGLVLIEAMACGTPVACYPTTGPIDVVRDGIAGFLNEDLNQATKQALRLDRSSVRQEALRFSWGNVANRFAALHGLNQDHTENEVSASCNTN